MKRGTDILCYWKEKKSDLKFFMSSTLDVARSGRESPEKKSKIPKKIPKHIFFLTQGILKIPKNPPKLVFNDFKVQKILVHVTFSRF